MYINIWGASFFEKFNEDKFKCEFFMKSMSKVARYAIPTLQSIKNLMYDDPRLIKTSQM